MPTLSTWDYGIVVVYFLALIAIGQVLRRRASASMDDYFLGGRKMPWWLLGVSGMAAWLDMTGTMLITSFLFMLGPRGLFVEFRGGAGLVLVFLLLWQGKWHRRSGCMTLAEWMDFRFGRTLGGQMARFMAIVATVIFTVGMLAYSFLGAGLFLSTFLPWSPAVCALILLVVTLIYTAEAGFYGVVVADLFQMAIVLVATAYVVVTAVQKIHTVGDLAPLAAQVTGNEAWMNALPSWRTAMPAGYEEYGGLMLLTLFYLAKTVIQGLGVGYEPKYFGARNDRECGLLSFLCGWLMSIRWAMMIGFVVLGMFLVRQLFQDQTMMPAVAQLIQKEAGPVEASQWSACLSELANHPDRFGAGLVSQLEAQLGPDWPRKLPLISFDGGLNPERVLPAVLLLVIPIGLRGLVLVALLAAAMSTFNIFINATTAYFTRDIYQRHLRAQASNRELMAVNWVFGAVLVGISFLLAFSAKNINDLWGWLMMGLSGGLIVPLCLRFFWWRFNGMGFAMGTLAGIAAAIAQRALWPQAPEWQQFVLVTCVGLVGSVLGTYTAAPTERRVLEHFYLRTRPLGLWRPLQATLTPEVRQRTRAEHRRDLLALPFTFGWQVTVLLLPLLLVIGSFNAAGVTGAVLLLCLAGMYVFWYRHLPEVEETNRMVESTGAET